MVRSIVVSLALACALVPAASLRAQGLLADARRVGMGGVSLGRDGTLERYNAAYRAVPGRPGAGGGPKFSIPIPLGLIQFFHDHPISHLSKDPLFNPDSAGFNPVELVDLVLNLPVYLQIKQPPTPTNDVTFGVGKDSLQVDLGLLQAVIPSDAFGVAGTMRPLDIEPSIKGFRFGAMVWLYDDIELQLGDSLLAFLKEGHKAQHHTAYDVTGDALAVGGVAPSIGFSGKVYGDQSRAMYLGVAAHYYLGLAYGHSIATGGFTTGDTIFAGPSPVTPELSAQTAYSKWGNTPGHGVGVDVGVVWVAGPIEFGVGVNDIGATLTFTDTRIDFSRFDTTTNTVVRDSSQLHRESKVKLPVTYIANVAYTTGPTTLGVNLLNSGRGVTIHVGAEQRFGPLALRGGVSRDQRKRLQFAWGGGIRFGPFELNAGFWTHSNALSDERGITLGTSLAIY